MMKRTRLMLAGAMLILLTNAVVLGGAAYNRSADPESGLQLTQRELQPDRWVSNKDNNGITLKLSWRVQPRDDDNQYGGNWWNPLWLDAAQMKQLGFDVNRIKTSARRGSGGNEVSRDVLLVLELDGVAYHHALRQAEEDAVESRRLLKENPDKEEFKRRAEAAEKRLEQERSKSSRLFAVDAGLDIQKLRAAYPDRAHYAIVRGRIRPGVVRDEKSEDKYHVSGWIDKVYADEINVPLEYRPVFEKEAPYTVTVAFGKRLEPWITEAVRLPALNQSPSEITPASGH